MLRQKNVVVSAVNFSEGGPLTVLQESLEAAAKYLPSDWNITALVHQKNLISIKRVETLEFPHSKRSWLVRLYLEWFEFNRISRTLKPDLWLSLHDITPRVQTRRQAVYCHNPSSFYRISLKEARLEPKFALFNLLYRYLYGIYISRNHSVVVQQVWLRDAFKRLYSLDTVVVAYPTQSINTEPSVPLLPPIRKPTALQPLVMFYPAFPRVFKNFEVLCEAMQLLSPHIRGLLEVRLTVCGNENAYARELIRRFSSLPGVKFIGRQTKPQMDAEYRACDLVLFPSKLETWGLPITEAKAHGKPLLVADLPYAHETVGNCDAAVFLPAQDAQSWATAFENVAIGHFQFSRHTFPTPDEPFAADWSQLWRMLTAGL